MKKTFAFGIASAQGNWPVQEDGYFADPVHGLFAIADGFGGKGAGDIAAKTAIQALGAAGEAPGTGGGSPEGRRQQAAFASAHKAIQARNEGRSSSARGGCSVLAVQIGESGFLSGTQCGACVALLVRGGKISVLLSPQCPPREEFLPPLPDQALGLPEGPLPESRNLQLLPGDLVVLASGGVEWDTETFQLELVSQLSVRAPGEDLSPLAAQLLENGSLASQSWNRTLLLLEKS